MSDRLLTRRRVIQGGIAAGLALTGIDRLTALGRGGIASAADAFATPLRIPTELTAADVTLTAGPADVQVLPGAPTRMWTFNGEFPGPTIRRPSGTPTRVTLDHRLPAADTLTLHHHGAHAAPDDDGQPRPEVAVAPGTRRTYTYGLREDGAPERAAPQWYHDHSHGRTERNTWNGLCGLFIVEDDFERRLPLPRGASEVPLVITGRRFDDRNQLVDPAAFQSAPPFDDTPETAHLVNGTLKPHLAVEPRRYRLRILNASSFHPYNLGLDGGQLVQIGTESGLLPAPVRRAAYVIGPGERIDLIADFTGLAGRTVTLSSSAFSGQTLATQPADAPLMQFRVAGAPVRDRTSVPDELRPLPEWTRSIDRGAVDHVWAFGLGADEHSGQTAWTINGRPFDHERVDLRAEIGSVQRWLLVNASGHPMSHYIHIHGVDWYVLSRNGRPPTGSEDGLKETFRLDPGEVLLVAGKVTDFLGPYMVHCHMLNHEDHGMMSTWEVVPRGKGDRLAERGRSTTVARLNGRDVRVPLDGIAPAARPGVRRVLDRVAARPGRPAPLAAPAAPVKVAAVPTTFNCPLPGGSR
jgi:FtsP/CotA-like multicopper oxidase with cupredoxin domain